MIFVLNYIASPIVETKGSLFCNIFVYLSQIHGLEKCTLSLDKKNFLREYQSFYAVHPQFSDNGRVMNNTIENKFTTECISLI